MQKSLGDKNHPKPSTDFLTQFLEHVIKFNNFMFNGEHNLQISGTAMGTKMASYYMYALYG